jgi:hypothetical protein
MTVGAFLKLPFSSLAPLGLTRLDKWPQARCWADPINKAAVLALGGEIGRPSGRFSRRVCGSLTLGQLGAGLAGVGLLKSALENLGGSNALASNRCHFAFALRLRVNN